jgi:hypothetical protein
MEIDTLQTVRVTEYPFVVNGPDCGCGHRRVRHIGPNPTYGVVTFDEACQDCEECEHYRPAGDVDYEAMREAEGPEHMRIVNENMLRRARRQRFSNVLLYLVMLTIPLALVKPELWPAVAGISFGALSILMVARDITAWRDGDMGRAEAVTSAIITGSIITITLALVIHDVLLGAMGAVIGTVALVAQHRTVMAQYRNAFEKLQRIEADLGSTEESS